MQMQLKIEDLDNILTELQHCAVQWFRLGLKLGLTYDDLTPIRGKCRGDDEEALLEMLAKVLHRQRMKITWETVAEAVRSVGRNDIAETIIENQQFAGTLFTA